MAVPGHVSLVTLGVADLARSIEFYDALGWHRSSASVDGVVSFYAIGGVALGLFGHDDLAEDAGVTTSDPPGYRGVSLSINVSSDDEVVEALRAAQAAGATLIKSARMAVFEGLAGYFADPDGHLWEVAHNPAFPLAADGSVTLPD